MKKPHYFDKKSTSDVFAVNAGDLEPDHVLHRFAPSLYLFSLSTSSIGK